MYCFNNANTYAAATMDAGSCGICQRSACRPGVCVAVRAQAPRQRRKVPEESTAPRRTENRQGGGCAKNGCAQRHTSTEQTAQQPRQEAASGMSTRLAIPLAMAIAGGRP